MHAFERDIYLFIEQIIVEHVVHCLLAVYLIVEKIDTWTSSDTQGR